MEEGILEPWKIIWKFMKDGTLEERWFWTLFSLICMFLESLYSMHAKLADQMLRYVASIVAFTSEKPNTHTQPA